MTETPAQEDWYFKDGLSSGLQSHRRSTTPPVAGGGSLGTVEVSTIDELIASISKYGGEREIKIVRPFNMGTQQILVDHINNFILTGMGRASTLTCGALGDHAIEVIDSDDIIIDNLSLNLSGQTAGNGINLMEVRRSYIGTTFLRIDNAHENGIEVEGTGGSPDSSVVNSFGNLYIYTCGGNGYEETGFAADNVIRRGYFQANVGHGILAGGTHLQILSAHLHENHLCGIAVSSHDVVAFHVNIEGNYDDGILCVGSSGSQGMKNAFHDVFAFGNNAGNTDDHSDVRCEGTTAKWNYFGRIRALKELGHTRYGYSDTAASGSGNNNLIHALYAGGHETASKLLGTGTTLEYEFAT